MFYNKLPWLYQDNNNYVCVLCVYSSEQGSQVPIDEQANHVTASHVTNVNKASTPVVEDQSTSIEDHVTADVGNVTVMEDHVTVTVQSAVYSDVEGSEVDSDSSSLPSVPEHPLQSLEQLKYQQLCQVYTVCVCVCVCVCTLNYTKKGECVQDNLVEQLL